MKYCVSTKRKTGLLQIAW